MERKVRVSLLMILIVSAAFVASMEFFVTPASCAYPTNTTLKFRVASENYTSFTVTRDWLYEDWASTKTDQVGLAKSNIPGMGSKGKWLNYTVPAPTVTMDLVFGASDGHKIPITIPKASYLNWRKYLSLEPFTKMWIYEIIELESDAKGVLYIDNTGDVDVYAKTTDPDGTSCVGPVAYDIGDGATDPAGSMIINMTTVYRLWIGTTMVLPTPIVSHLTLTTKIFDLTVEDTQGGNKFNGLHTSEASGTPMVGAAPWTFRVAYTGVWVNVHTGALIYGDMDSFRWEETTYENVVPEYPKAGFVPTPYWDLPAQVNFYRAHSDPTISPYKFGASWVGEVILFEARSCIGTGNPWFPLWPDAQKITHWEWDFEGDGTYDYDDTTHGFIYWRYSTPGIYKPKLRVTTADGKVIVGVMNITVYPTYYWDRNIHPVMGIEIKPVFGDIIGPGGWATNPKKDKKVTLADILVLALPGNYGADQYLNPWDESTKRGYHVAYDVGQPGKPGVPDGKITLADILLVAKVGIYGYDGSGSGVFAGPGW